MKKIIVFLFILLISAKINAMGWLLYGNGRMYDQKREWGDEIWKATEKKLKKLGMSDKDFTFSNSNKPLDRSILTPFWKQKEQAQREEKNKLLSTILPMSYADWHDQKIHIASAILIGADPDTCYNNNTGFPFGSLRKAYEKQDVGLALFLLQKGADPQKQLILEDEKKWYQPIQQIQIQKQQEELARGLKFLATKAVLKKYPSIEERRELQTLLPADLIEYLEKEFHTIKLSPIIQHKTILESS